MALKVKKFYLGKLSKYDLPSASLCMQGPVVFICMQNRAKPPFESIN